MPLKVRIANSIIIKTNNASPKKLVDMVLTSQEKFTKIKWWTKKEVKE